MSRQSLLAVLACAISLLGGTKFARAAATLNLKLVYVQSVNSTNSLVNGTGQYSTPLTDGGTIPAGMVSPTDRHRFAYLFSITGQASDESLLGMQTRVVRSGWNTSLAFNTAISLSGYGSFQNPTWDPDSSGGDNPTPRLLFQLNGDTGPFTSDYLTMRALTDGNFQWHAAHHYNPGENGDYYLGRMTFALATPSTPGVYTLSLQKDGTQSTGFFAMYKGGGEFDNQGTASYAEYTPNINNSTFTITVVPEPVSILLMGLGLPAVLIVARRHRGRLLLGFMACAVMLNGTIPAGAATLNLKLVYVQSVNSTLALINGTGQYSTPLTDGGTIPAGMVDPTDRHRFAYLFSITGQAPDESLHHMQTKVVRNGWNAGLFLQYNTSLALGPYSFTNPSWNPDTDADDDPPPRTLFWLNADSGAFSNDYLTMRAVADGNDEWYAAHHYNPGESGDYYLGRMSFSLATPSMPGVYSLSVEKDGTGSTGFFIMWKGGTENDQGGPATVVDFTSNINNATFTITVVPEPATLVLTACGLPAVLIAARRRMRRR